MLGVGGAAAAEQTFQFDIPAEPLGQALTDFSRESAQQIVFSEEVTNGLRTAGLHGRYTAAAALNALLAGTGLNVERNSDSVMMVRPKNAEAASNDGAADPNGTADGRIETVTVTAEKREESALDVPIALTALGGAQLERSQSYRFEDYVAKVPGLTVIDNGAVGSQLVIRGITNGVNVENTSVATYIDETPFTEAGPFAGASFAAPNLDTFDMQRIEVLKGPQGTLYGANALGGLLKFVTNAPDPTAFVGRLAAGVSSTENGGTGFDLHGMVNVPLADDAALRVVGYDTYYPGFIDDPSRGVKDINGTHFTGGRASLLYTPTTDLSVRFNALYQVRAWGDWPNEDVNAGTLTPLHGDLVQEHLIAQPGRLTTQLYNVTVNWDVGFANLVSTTSYYSNNNHNIEDFSDSYEPLLTGIFGAPYGVAIQARKWYVHAFTQELRLSSSGDEPLQWQVGGYFTNERGDEDTIYPPIDGTTGKILFDDPLGLGGFVAPVHYREYAGFANLDYHFTPTFDIGLGGRYSENSQDFHETAPGIFGGGFDFGTASSESVFTYSADARWHVTPQNMFYARVASGFAPGGPNDAVPNQVVPSSYKSSKTLNYEVGVKSSLLDDNLTLELSAFDIEWSDIQLNAIVGGFGTITNGGKAQSRGVEWNAVYRPIDGLTLQLNGAYTDAHLTQPTPASVNGHAGDRLPSSPLWGTYASAEYERPLFDDYSGFAGVDWRFNGSRYADFQATGPRQEMPQFGIVDLRAGIERQGWSLALYAKNVGNEIAINYVQPESLAGGSGPQSASVWQPRTIGATLTSNF